MVIVGGGGGRPDGSPLLNTLLRVLAPSTQPPAGCSSRARTVLDQHVRLHAAVGAQHEREARVERLELRVLGAPESPARVGTGATRWGEGAALARPWVARPRVAALPPSAIDDRRPRCAPRRRARRRHGVGHDLDGLQIPRHEGLPAHPEGRSCLCESTEAAWTAPGESAAANTVKMTSRGGPRRAGVRRGGRAAATHTRARGRAKLRGACGHTAHTAITGAVRATRTWTRHTH